MATASKKKRTRSEQCQFRESAPLASRERVDKEKCILYGVRVLGLESDNDRVYLREAVVQAIAKGIYERKSVRMNHPDPDSKADKPVEDINGWLENVRATDDGARGDWHLNPEHPMTPRILWAAEHNPEQYGLSHNVTAAGEPQNGKFVITEIVSCASVDLVSDPATVRGLFESKGNPPVVKKIKRRVLLEGLRTKLNKWRPKFPKTIRRTLEAMDDAMGDTETMQEDEEELAKVDHEEHLKKGIYEACHSIIESEDMSADEKHSKIKDLLKAHEKLTTAKEGEEEEKDVDVEGGGGEADEPLKKAESRKLRQELDELKAERGCRRLCESMNFTPTETFLEALVKLPSDEKRKALIKETIKSSGTGRPRSGSMQESYRPGPHGEDSNAAIDTNKITSNEGFLNALRGAN